MRANINTLIAEFQKTHPDVDEYRGDMIQALQYGGAQTLEEAYAMALQSRGIVGAPAPPSAPTAAQPPPAPAPAAPQTPTVMEPSVAASPNCYPQTVADRDSLVRAKPDLNATKLWTLHGGQVTWCGRTATDARGIIWHWVRFRFAAEEWDHAGWMGGRLLQ